MRKVIAGLAAVILFGAGTVAASTNITFLTLNGGPNATVPVGNTVQANVQYDLVSDTTTSDTESLSWQVLDGAGNAALPPVCVDIADRSTAGTFNTSFPIGTGGQTEGTWDVRVKTFGYAGTAANNNCAGSSSDSRTFSNVLTLTTPADSSTQTGNPFPGNSTGYCALFPADCSDTGTGLTPPTGFNGGLGQTGTSLKIFCKLHPELCGIVIPPTATSTLPPPPQNNDALICANVATLSAGLGFGSGGRSHPEQIAMVQSLQIFLMSNGGSIGYGATGYFGPQTLGALGAVKISHHCI